MFSFSFKISYISKWRDGSVRRVLSMQRTQAGFSSINREMGHGDNFHFLLLVRQRQADHWNPWQADIAELVSPGCRVSHCLKSRKSWQVTEEGTQCQHLTFMHIWKYTHIRIHIASCVLKYRLCPITHSLFKNTNILLYLFRVHFCW